MPSQTEVITAPGPVKPADFGSKKAEGFLPVRETARLPFETENFITSLDAVEPEAFDGDEVDRLRVRAAARRLLARVETPYERAWGFCFEQPVVFAALQTCIDTGLWKSWTVVGGERSIDELVDFTTPTVDTNLLRESSLSPYELWPQSSDLKDYRPFVSFASGLQRS